ncbi:1-acyl-sn-glycerol-3-phosphate acyltransferase [Comamonas sp. Y33R10-2]|uniref:lysophospholipid acyltransferase family protein n=1 Tax=Comamonas sp. Y33R10-2 TaxID=2853257 RepID=UPI001C5C9336|nr:lysophospholipid acyltransferase family protein [Comamonas sp. Y33R10-2]QXZ09296.1 1-acyl-sn-glycerol-3-phosphate acyltransferase [Comamonas sp. Y33R10-2]
MSLIRSVLHMLWMVVTVIPYTIAVLLTKWISGSSSKTYRVARAWLKLSVDSAKVIMGVQCRVQGMENLPTDPKQGVVLLVKHQSTYETFLMPAIMPRPLAYVFKKELLKVPFFGWSIGALDMIHIDRAHGSRAFHKVVEQGKRLLDQGTWVIMFPEGTRIARGEKGEYKTGATRLAIMTGAPVVPIAVTSAKCWPRKAFIKKPGVVDVSIGKPIPSIGRKHEELMAEVEAWIEAEMQRLDPDAYADKS